MCVYFQGTEARWDPGGGEEGLGQGKQNLRIWTLHFYSSITQSALLHYPNLRVNRAGLCGNTQSKVPAPQQRSITAIFFNMINAVNVITLPPMFTSLLKFCGGPITLLQNQVWQHNLVYCGPTILLQKVHYQIKNFWDHSLKHFCLVAIHCLIFLIYKLQAAIKKNILFSLTFLLQAAVCLKFPPVPAGGAVL